QFLVQRFPITVFINPFVSDLDNSPDEALVDDFPIIDKKAVEQLTEGLISHYLPDLQQSKLALKELTQNQEVLLETVQQEISKFKECSSILDINMLFSEAKYYHNKLVNIRKEMLMLHEKTSKLKCFTAHSKWFTESASCPQQCGPHFIHFGRMEV
uniref:Biosis of lysosomal organelles complex 1 subunit 6 n=1 Tax=Laticauda laticaudata TaxID=8630 RepID=A0A8C5SH17_LATLA